MLASFWGSTMHIHHNPITLGNAGMDSAAAAEKAAAAQRAATRQKLLKSAGQIDGTLDSGELFMIGKWSEDQPGKREGQMPRRQSDTQAAEEEIVAKPISVWA
jgi:hypothetical protein